MPGSARVFWDGGGSPVTISDVSAGGCLLGGEQLPDVGTRVFLSLDIGGLPNVRLPATTVRRELDDGAGVAAVRFDVPVSSTGGLDKLLAQHVRPRSAGLAVVIVDGDARSRERIADAVRQAGAHVIATASAAVALADARALEVNVVLARADDEGLRALTGLGRSCPNAFRVAFGRKSAIDAALASGAAQAAADDPCSAKCLSELLQKRRARTPS